MPDGLPFDPTAPKALPAPGARKELSKFDYAVKFLEQQGRCFNCGERLVKGKVVDEHMVPRENLPADKCDDLENRKLFCRPCAKAKTVTDQDVIAKARHQRGGKGSQRAKREARGHGSIQGNAKIPSHKLRSNPSFASRPSGGWPSRKIQGRGK